MQRQPRSLIREHLRSMPGASTKLLSEALALDPSTMDYHLRKLGRDGKVVRETVGRETCWFDASDEHCPVLRRALPALRRAGVGEVARVLGDVPQVMPVLADAAGLTVGEARWAVTALDQAGLIVRTSGGRVGLAPGADRCLAKALAREPCGLWGQCIVSRATAARTNERSAVTTQRP